MTTPSRFASTVVEQEPVSLKPLSEGKTGAYVATYGNGFRAVIKPVKPTLPSGKTAQRGISARSHPRREVAFYQLAKLFGFDMLVPETVLTRKAVPGTEASAQLFMPAVPLRQLQPRLADIDRDDWVDLLVATAHRVPKHNWRQLLALDIVAGSRDRHANNVGLMLHYDSVLHYRLVAWDNAVTFGLTFDRYHNVFHKFLFRKSVNFDAIWPIWNRLTLEDFTRVLGPYLQQDEINHAFLRMRFFLDYPYRLPWRVVSQNHDDPHDFPSYASYFEPVAETRSSHPVGGVPFGASTP